MAASLIRKRQTTYTQTSGYLYASAHLLPVVARNFDHVLYRKGKYRERPALWGGPLPLAVRGSKPPGDSGGGGIPGGCGGSPSSIGDPMAGIGDPMAGIGDPMADLLGSADLAVTCTQVYSGIDTR